MIIKLTDKNEDIRILKNVEKFEIIKSTINIYQSNNRHSGYNMMYYTVEFFDTNKFN